MQRQLVQAVSATGKPVVVVLVNGRPLATPWISDHVPAILEAWFPGEKGGEAVADILFGDVNPSGKLPITVPRHAGQLPVYYDYKPSKQYWLEEGWGNSYVDIAKKPLYEFGFGLSYTTYQYSDLVISPKTNGTEGSFNVKFNVKNTGKMAGYETTQLYIRDVKSSVVRPVKELKGFQKVNLKPGESTSVSFTLTPHDLSMLDRDLNRVVEPGVFKIMIGSSSDDIRLQGNCEVKGSE
jgi:beta-glucosidase